MTNVGMRGWASAVVVAVLVAGMPPSQALALRPTIETSTESGLEESLLGRATRRLTRYLALTGLIAGLSQGPVTPPSQAATLPPLPVPPPAATLPRAIVTPSTITLTFPVGVTGAVAGYLRTDQWYLQGHTAIPENGTVSVQAISVNPPNFPGWVAADDRMFVVATNSAAFPPVSSGTAIRGATLVVRVAPDGRLTVVTGRWPASPFQVGAGPFGPLRQFLGPGRTIGLMVEGNPAQILTMTRGGTNVFDLAVRAGYDTVWIDGSGFTRLSPGARQELVIHAANARLETVGFIQGAVGLSNPATQAATLSAFSAQYAAVGALDLGPLTVQWVTDFEEHLNTDRPWDGDMTAAMQTAEQVVAGARRLAQDYRIQHPNVTRNILEDPPVLQFGGTWLVNGSRPDPAPGIVPGAVVHGIRPVSGAGLAGATFQTDETVIASTGNQVSRRALEESAALQTNVNFIYVVESGAQTDGKTFAGQVPNAGPALFGALRQIPSDRSHLLGGVAVHASDAANAVSGIQQLLATTTVAVGPAGRTVVWRDTVNRSTRLRFWTDTTATGSYTLPATFADAELRPYFNGDEYLFVVAKGRRDADGLAVFGTRRPTPGTTRGIWTARPLTDALGNTTVFLDRDPAAPDAGPITIRSVLPRIPRVTTPNNQIAIQHAFTNNSSATGTIVVTITPAGLEEAAEQFLRERQGVERATGRLA